MAINNIALNLTAQPIYTSVGNTVVSTIHLCNITTNPINANLFVVPNGSTPHTVNTIYYYKTISPSDTLIIDKEKFILSNGDSIQANISATFGVSATVTYTGI